MQSFLVESKGHSNAWGGGGLGGSLPVVGEADFQLQGSGDPWASNSNKIAYTALVSRRAHWHTELVLGLR